MKTHAPASKRWESVTELTVSCSLYSLDCNGWTDRSWCRFRIGPVELAAITAYKAVRYTCLSPIKTLFEV